MIQSNINLKLQLIFKKQFCTIDQYNKKIKCAKFLRRMKTLYEIYESWRAS